MGHGAIEGMRGARHRRVPGDPEYRAERTRAVDGIPVEPGLQKELQYGGEASPPAKRRPRV